MFWGTLLLENLHYTFHVLGTRFGTHKRGIRRIYHHHVPQTDRGHDSSISVDDRSLTVDIDHATDYDIAGLILRRHFIQTAPTSHIRPSKGDRHDCGLRGLLHHTCIDRHRRQLSIFLIDRRPRCMLLHQLTNLLNPAKESRLVATD